MKIRDFDLDLPYVRNEENIALIQKESGCSREEAIKQDNRENWAIKRSTFSYEARCTTALFARLFKSFHTKDCKKILVNCVDEITDDVVRNFTGFYEVQVRSDYEAFNAMDDDGKKRRTLELLMEGIRKVVADQGWSMEPFEEAYDEIVKLDYINEFFWKKTARNKETRNVAKIFIQHQVQKTDISMVIFDKKGNEIHRELIITEKPDELLYSWYLGSLEWIDTDTVVLTSQIRDEKIAVSL